MEKRVFRGEMQNVADRSEEVEAKDVPQGKGAGHKPVNNPD